MLGGSVAVDLCCEFRFLKHGIGGHLAFLVAAGQLEHAVVQLVETSQRDELEFVAHRAQLALELGNRRIVQVFFQLKEGEQL